MKSEMGCYSFEAEWWVEHLKRETHLSLPAPKKMDCIPFEICLFFFFLMYNGAKNTALFQLMGAD